MLAIISLIIDVVLLIMFIVIYINTKNTKIDTKDIYENQYKQTEYLVKINSLISSGYTVVNISNNSIIMKKGDNTFNTIPDAWNHYIKSNKSKTP